MDTRQLAAFCAVVERKSFSQAAERLGVTQPAVSLQIRSLEQRLGRQLLDRSGRRVEPTEAGLRLYASAQRLLQLEEQLLEELAADAEGVVDGTLELALPESVRSAVLAGHGITFISRLAIEADLAAGGIATARVRGLDPVREILLARASGRSETRAARAFVSYAREHLPS